MLEKYSTQINWTIRILVAVMFIFGAWAKGVAIFQFDKQLADLGFDWCIVPYVSRLIIGFELFLGLALLQPHFLKEAIIPMTVLLLVAFCVHLGIIIAQSGGADGNCGCFGKSVPMTPRAAFIKNIISIVLLVWLFMKYKSKEKSNAIVPTLLLIASLALTFVYIKWTSYCCFCPGGQAATAAPIVQMAPAPVYDTSTTAVRPAAPEVQPGGKEPVKGGKTQDNTTTTPVTNGTTQTTPTPVQQGPAQKTSLFAPYKNFSKGVTANLDEGVKVVCLFNLECDHCMATCKDIGELDKTMDMPAYLICWSEPGNEPAVYQPLAAAFFKTTGIEYPYTVVGPEIFFPLLGSAPSPPRIVVLHNGNIIADWDSNSFSKEKLKEVLTHAGVK